MPKVFFQIRKKECPYSFVITVMLTYTTIITVVLCVQVMRNKFTYVSLWILFSVFLDEYEKRMRFHKHHHHHDHCFNIFVQKSFLYYPTTFTVASFKKKLVMLVHLVERKLFKKWQEQKEKYPTKNERRGSTREFIWYNAFVCCVVVLLLKGKKVKRERSEERG